MSCGYADHFINTNVDMWLQAGARQDIEKCLDIVFISRNQPSEAAEVRHSVTSQILTC